MIHKKQLDGRSGPALSGANLMRSVPATAFDQHPSNTAFEKQQASRRRRGRIVLFSLAVGYWLTAAAQLICFCPIGAVPGILLGFWLLRTSSRIREVTAVLTGAGVLSLLASAVHVGSRASASHLIVSLAVIFITMLIHIAGAVLVFTSRSVEEYLYCRRTGPGEKKP